MKHFSVLFFIFLFSSCYTVLVTHSDKNNLKTENEKTDSIKTPNWLSVKIDSLKNDVKHNPPIEINQCEYNNDTIFVLMTELGKAGNQENILFKFDGTIICSFNLKSGYINDCRNIFFNLKNRKLIWRDSRFGIRM